MITKAIVEEIVTPYKVRIRIPLLDQITSAAGKTNLEDLNTATICSLPNCYINVQVGDVVFVAFEDNTLYKAVILGHLSREAMTNTYADVTFGRLLVNSGATLPDATQIGEVTSSEIAHLTGLRDNIQRQIDYLKELIDGLSYRIDGTDENKEGGNA